MNPPVARIAVQPARAKPAAADPAREQTARCLTLYALPAARKPKSPSSRRTTDLYIAATASQDKDNFHIIG